ncbi:MAG: hypothetical protein DRJ49_03680 [Thermoprotei archaeon]|nr:MAG: hypothetical protein DRJ49_03680 [Thermoprotei archaeon]
MFRPLQFHWRFRIAINSPLSYKTTYYTLLFIVILGNITLFASEEIGVSTCQHYTCTCVEL